MRLWILHPRYLDPTGLLTNTQMIEPHPIFKTHP